MADHGSVKLLQLTTLLSAIRFHSTLATYTTVDEVKSLVFITIRYRLTSCAAAATRLRSSLTTHVHESGSSLESVCAHMRRNRVAGAKRAVVPQYFMTIFVKNHSSDLIDVPTYQQTTDNAASPALEMLEMKLPLRTRSVNMSFVGSHASPLKLLLFRRNQVGNSSQSGTVNTHGWSGIMT